VQGNRTRRLAALAAAAIVVYGVSAVNAAGATRCDKDYSYAGLIGKSHAYGIRAKLTVVRRPQVRTGHVAGWVGLGGPGLGPKGTDEWIQVGYSGFNGGSSQIYYEVVRSGGGPVYTHVANIKPGETHYVGVAEMRTRRGWWRVWVDGRVVSKPIYLPGSHGAWEPVATAESWNAGTGRCNQFNYRFSRVAYATRPNNGYRLLQNAWMLQDTPYRVAGRSAVGFTARGRS
jgi:hypothetical protein